MNKTLIHLIAYPATGKFTIAKALKKQLGAYLIDNHTINNVFFSVTDLSQQLPPQVFSFISKAYDLLFDYLRTINPQKPLILTNCLCDSEGDLAFVSKTQALCKDIGYKYLPIKLILDEEEMLRRLPSADRKAKMKLTNPELLKHFIKTYPLITKIEGAVEIDINGNSIEDTVAAVKKYLV